MSELIEQSLVSSPGELDALRRTIEAVFHNEHGQRLLALLIKGRHPMMPRFDPAKPDALAAAFRDGQADIIGFLWRYGAQFNRLTP